MKKGIIIALSIIAVLVFIGVGRYNSLVTLNEAVGEKWAQVENVYQRRMDLIPNLVATVKGYAEHEQETLEGVVQARAKATQTTVNVNSLSDQSKLDAFNQAQGELSSMLSRLMVVVERYPDLKANESFLALQSQLEGTENRITVERKRFNEVVRQFNTTVKRFPTNMFASMFGFQEKAYFKSEPAAQTAPKVEF